MSLDLPTLDAQLRQIFPDMPKMVRKMTLEIEVDCIPAMTITYYPETSPIQSVTKRYSLAEIDEPMVSTKA